MTRTCRRASRVVPGVLVLSLCFSSPLLAQRSDRATITGVVTDEQGHAISRATVTIHSVETGVDTVLVTNDAGAYQSLPLVLGRYTVTVNLTVFKKATTPEMLLSGGDLARRDLTIAAAVASVVLAVPRDANAETT